MTFLQVCIQMKCKKAILKPFHEMLELYTTKVVDEFWSTMSIFKWTFKLFSIEYFIACFSIIRLFNYTYDNRFLSTIFICRIFLTIFNKHKVSHMYTSKYTFIFNYVTSIWNAMHRRFKILMLSIHMYASKYVFLSWSFVKKISSILYKLEAFYLNMVEDVFWIPLFSLKILLTSGDILKLHETINMYVLGDVYLGFIFQKIIWYILHM